MERRSGCAGWAGSIAVLFALACASPADSRDLEAAAKPGPGEPAERATVFYPLGTCATGWLEVEVFERETGSWRAHPRHPWLRAGSCAQEDPGVLLNELRVRCADPGGVFAPSRWVVGVELRGVAAGSACGGGLPAEKAQPRSGGSG